MLVSRKQGSFMASQDFLFHLRPIGDGKFAALRQAGKGGAAAGRFDRPIRLSQHFPHNLPQRAVLLPGLPAEPFYILAGEQDVQMLIECPCHMNIVCTCRWLSVKAGAPAKLMNRHSRLPERSASS